MPHRIHKCTNTLYGCAIIHYYVSLMCEIKKNGKVFTSKFVGTGPSSYEKSIYRATVSQRLRNTALGHASILPKIKPRQLAPSFVFISQFSNHSSIQH